MEMIENWSKKTTKQKTKLIVGCAVWLIVLAYVVILFASKAIFGADFILTQVFYPNSAATNYSAKVLALLKSVGLIVLTYAISRLLRFVLNKCLKVGRRGMTALKLIDSAIKYIAAILMVILVLNAWGVDTATILASAGILGLVIGLGAQSLIEDIIAGVFIVFEHQFGVGDIVVIDGWRGTVQEIGMRTTKIVDAGGNIKIISNSEIKSLVNQTQELSVVFCTIGTEYGESLTRIEIVIRDNIDKLKERLPAVVEGPFYKGVTALGASSVDLLFVAKCKEEDFYQVSRDLNRELKLLFDANNINIPFPQVVLNQPPVFESKVTKKMETGAREFVQEQKELSKEIEEKTN